MYPFWIVREIVKNAVVRVAPTLAMRMRGATGRGEGVNTPEVVAAYCWDVFHEYASLVELSPTELFRGKTVIELGPGDNLGVGLLALAHGATRHVAFDRYGILRQDAWARALYTQLLERLPKVARASLEERRIIDESGLPRLGDQLAYTVDFGGAERLLGSSAADLIISRAVLEHVHDLGQVLVQCGHALRRGGSMIHKADLRDHGFRVSHPLDFLRPSPSLYRWMTSARGVHNRARRSDYLALLAQNGFELVRMREEHDLSPAIAEEIRPRLAHAFRSRPVSDLTCTVLFFASARR